MKKFLLLFLLPLSAWAITRNITISAPASVTAGQSFVVPTSASTDASDGEQIGFYHAEFSTDGGASWTGYCYDVNVGTSATRNAYITAGGVGSTILIRVRIAFRGGAAGDVDYVGGALDWGGTWTNWQTPPTQYASISVVAPPNQPPAINWIQNPTSASVNQWFVVQAQATDPDGNLQNIWVWKEWVPFAVNGGGNGYVSNSDPNGTYGSVPGTINFQAQSFDTSGANSAVIFHTVNVINHAPDNFTLTLSGATLGYNSTYQHYTLWSADATITGSGAITATSTLHDPDGNLVNHTLRYQRVLGASADNGAWTIMGNSTPSNPTNSTKTGSLTIETPGRWDFSAFGHDGFISHPGNALTVWVYGSTNGATFVSQSINGTTLTGATPSISLNSGALTGTATILMQNTGNKPWQNPDTQFGTPHRLGAIGPNPTDWGATKRDMSTSLVDPASLSATNNTATFTFTFNIPQTPGLHTFQWKMMEDGVVGNPYFEAASTAVTVNVIDTTPPTKPVIQSPSTVTSTSFRLNWTASVENGPTLSYDVYRKINGAFTKIGNTTNNFFDVTGLLSGITYTLKVVAVDGVALTNESATADIATVFDPNADNDGDGVSNGVELALGLNPNDPTDVRVFNFTYDKINQLKAGPGGQYFKDAEGNIKQIRP